MPGLAVVPPLDLVVVGAGLAAAPHLASLVELQSEGAVRVRHVIGRGAERAARLAAQLPGARPGTDLEAVLAEGPCDAVLLLTPPDTHCALGMRIAAAGKHLLVEKPVALTAAEARSLAQACTRHGVVGAAVLQHRARPAARRLKALLEEGALGNVHGAMVTVPWWRPQSYYDEPGRGTLARDGGGVLVTQAIHTLDLFLWLLGRPEAVQAQALTSGAHTMECEDTVAAVLRLRGGGVASVYASTASYPGFPERIEVAGSRGTALLSAGRLRAWMAEGRTLDVGDEVQAGSGADPMAFPHAYHRALISNFIAAARGLEPPLAAIDSAIDVQVLIETMLASSGRPSSLLPVDWSTP